MVCAPLLPSFSTGAGDARRGHQPHPDPAAADGAGEGAAVHPEGWEPDNWHRAGDGRAGEWAAGRRQLGLRKCPAPGFTPPPPLPFYLLRDRHPVYPTLPTPVTEPLLRGHVRCAGGAGGCIPASRFLQTSLG
ncbi:hypothetical protein chiPu_0026735 [Chiloscyllium punctatum]|uniref:Uncharacterized protein n=1 Tax=Chiloscyllium punctatum TaxID=137246 RepID=A0A401TIJ8_CHIPU|nr:hypothetical protein [Chiloscyllium punctatum]